MKIVIFWSDFLHYHIARISASIQLAKHSGHEIIPIAINSSSNELPLHGYHDLLGENAVILIEKSQPDNMNSRKSAYHLSKTLDKISPDVVAIPGYDNYVILTALKWCRCNRKGAILMCASQRKDFRRVLFKEIIKQGIVSLYDSAIAGGSPQAEYLLSLGMDNNRIFTGYDVVDNNFWSGWSSQVKQHPESWRKQLNLPGNYFLTAGRFIPKKNIPGLLRAYSDYVIQVSKPWDLVIIGDGVLSSELKNLAEELGITHLVHFLGYLSAEEMAPIYGLASVFILASSYSEQWGLVVNEAMAAGLPVLVSNICGCAPDLVIDGVTGFQFNPTNQNELSNLMRQCSNGSIDIKKIGENAQSHIQKYSPEIFAENLFKSAHTAVDYARTRKFNPWQLILTFIK